MLWMRHSLAFLGIGESGLNDDCRRQQATATPSMGHDTHTQMNSHHISSGPTTTPSRCNSSILSPLTSQLYIYCPSPKTASRRRRQARKTAASSKARSKQAAPPDQHPASIPLTTTASIMQGISTLGKRRSSMDGAYCVNGRESARRSSAKKG